MPRPSFFTMDVITDLAFGSTWGCLVHDEDVGGWFWGMEQNLLPIPLSFIFPTFVHLLLIPIALRLLMASNKHESGLRGCLGRLCIFQRRTMLSSSSITNKVLEKRLQNSVHQIQKYMISAFLRRGVTGSAAVAEAGLSVSNVPS